MTSRLDYSAPSRHRYTCGLPMILLAFVLSACSAPRPTQQPAVDSSAVAGTTTGPNSASVPKGAPGAGGEQTQVPRLSNDQLLALALDQRAAGEYAPMEATLAQLLRQEPEAPLARRARF